MIVCVGKSCSFALLCVSLVYEYLFEYVLLSLLILGWDVALDCMNSDHCHPIYFVPYILLPSACCRIWYLSTKSFACLTYPLLTTAYPFNVKCQTYLMFQCRLPILPRLSMLPA